MTFEEWYDTYKPIPNTLGHNDCGPRIGDQPIMFETFGEDLDEVTEINIATPTCVWTLLDCDGELIIVAGLHWVNRMGYFMTEVCWTDPDLEVALD